MCLAGQNDFLPHRLVKCRGKLHDPAVSGYFQRVRGALDRLRSTERRPYGLFGGIVFRQEQARLARRAVEQVAFDGGAVGARRRGAVGKQGGGDAAQACPEFVEGWSVSRKLTLLVPSLSATSLPPKA
jgi:hypothetical protein